MGAVFAPTRFSLVRISIRDLVADRKSLVRNSRVGGGGENLILKKYYDHSKNCESLRRSVFTMPPKFTTPWTLL